MIGTILHSVATLPIMILFMWKVAECDGYNSQCPDVLSYMRNRLLEGHILVPRPQYTRDYEMKVHYCVPYNTAETPASSRFTINTDSTTHLKYKIVFPFRKPQPFIESIVFNDELMCQEYPDYAGNNKCFWISNVMHDAPRKHCGRAEISGDPTGPGIEREEWPWVVGIFRQQDSSSLEFLCGGSLVNERHILSSAHCFLGRDDPVINRRELFTKIGAHDLGRYFEEHTEIVGISAVMKHPSYKPKALVHDIAIVTLARDVKFTSYIQPVCLWATENDKPNEATVISWGQRKNNNTSVYAQKRIVSVFPLRSCEDRDFTYVNLMYNKTFCAGDPDQPGVCKGDSGSGLYIEEDRTWILRGIISNPTDGVCELGRNILYTDVTEYKQWILEHI